MLSKKIAILCVSESHSDNDQITKLNLQYGPNLHFTHTHNTQNPRSKGIVIVTNKNRTKSIPTNIHLISPGRAISFKTNWPENKKISILAVYPPNTPNENANFWKNLLTTIENEPTMQPDIIIGEFNTVEDAADRLPPHPDPPHIVEALLDLKGKFQLTDGWRRSNPPPNRGFTFEQPSGGSRSRIDRIYVTNDILNRSSEWRIEQPDVLTDHQLISVSVYDLNTPKIGRGRWALPKFLLNDENFLHQIELLNTENQNQTEPNPQKRLQNLILNIRQLAKRLERMKAGKMNSSIISLTNKRTKIPQNVNPNDPERLNQALEIASSITEKIQDIQRIRYKKNKSTTNANWCLQGELVNKYWCTHGKETKGRDTIMELRKYESNPASYSTNSKEMAEEMANYHEAIQQSDLDIPPLQREITTTSILHNLPKLVSSDSSPLQEQLTYDEIELALKHSPNNKAPSLNGIPTDLYKKLNQCFKRNKSANKPSLDIIATLTAAFNHIEIMGTCEKSLLKGWLCPTYKKKD